MEQEKCISQVEMQSFTYSLDRNSSFSARQFQYKK